MKVIIAGSRNCWNYKLIPKAVKLSGFKISKVISGAAFGIDLLAIYYAIHKRIAYDVFPIFPEDWQHHGKKAGYLRKISMSINADALIAIWDGKSRGTKMMIDIAKARNLKVFVYNI